MAGGSARRSLLDGDRIYYWEHLFAGSSYHAYMREGPCRWMIRHMAREYGVPIPQLSFVNYRNDRKLAWAQHTPNRITFNVKYHSVTAQIVAHEMAHVICWAYGFEEQSLQHGPVWLGLYVRLMSDYNIVPATAVCPSLDRYGFEYLSPYWCAPERFWDFEEPL